MGKLGEKIKLLRKQKNISQEVFANYLGISFQAVSKWENGNTMPDVTMLPAIASFFGVSIDALLDFNLYETEKKIEAIVDEHRKHIDTDRKKSQQIIRNGLKKYPGNDILLACLIGILDLPGQSDEIISIAKSLAKSTKQDALRFEAYCIMAEAYRAKGEYQAAKDAIEQIPEIYFTKLEVAAFLLEGEEMYRAAQKQKNLSAESLINMLILGGKYLKAQGESAMAISQFKIAKKIIDAFADDFLETKYFKSTVYEYMHEHLKTIDQLLNE